MLASGINHMIYTISSSGDSNVSIKHYEDMIFLKEALYRTAFHLAEHNYMIYAIRL